MKTTAKPKKAAEKLRFIDLYENRCGNEKDWGNVDEFLAEIADEIGSFIWAASSEGYFEPHIQQFMADMYLGAAKFTEYTQKKEANKV
jgi:hypothetical protein